MTDFIAIDFETATKDTGSACSVGIAVVENLKVVDSFYSLLQPPRNIFDESNVKIHNITPDMTENAPTLDDLWWQLKQWFSEHIPVVAHNVHFDVSVLRQSSQIDFPNFLYLDTISMVSPFISGRKTLDNCAVELGVDLGNHHNAQVDAIACAEIAIEILKREECVTMWEYLALNPDVKTHWFANLIPQITFGTHKKATKSHTKFSDVRPSDIAPTISCIDQTSLLYEKNIVFTGELTIDRATAMQIAVNAGAVIKSSVSKKVDFLVVGVQDETLVGDDGLSTKERKAHQLNDSGAANIEIIDEIAFLKLAKNEGNI